MCGIIGFNWEDRKFLRLALTKLNHRGPDDSGIYTDSGISLGHRRLSILDLSKKGRQPMSDDKGEIEIVFNGEIYNFKELKVDLEKKYNFKSDTDTEVLIYLYKELGAKMLEKLQGMFAFCIYDKRKKELFLARDRVGIKPLYYYFKSGRFAFSSEIKGILESSEVDKELYLKPLESYLIFRANIEKDTFFKNISKLESGSYAIFNLEKKNLKVKKYWQYNFKEKYMSERDYIREFSKILDNSVKDRLLSDVPYGAYLSGGVDSGTVVSLMKKHSPKEVKTFSVGFEEEEHSEASYAKEISESIGTDHHELLIGRKSIKKLPEIIYQSDEPVADPTFIPTHFLSQHTKKYCTVVLTGEGADELFGGYPQYKFMKAHQKIFRKFPKVTRRILPESAKRAPEFLINKGFKFASALGEKGIERFSNFIMSDFYETQYLEQISIFNEEEQRALLNKKDIDFSKYSKKFENSYKSGDKVVSDCQKWEIEGPMVEDLLMKVDKNTMSFSVEGRVPFLDHRLVELSMKVPEKLKLKGFKKDKYILRKSVRGLIPKSTKNRKKAHFFVPIDSWFKEELSSLKTELLGEKYLREQNIFNHKYIRKVTDGFDKSRLFYSRQLWSLLTFQIWYKQYIENEKIKI